MIQLGGPYLDNLPYIYLCRQLDRYTVSGCSLLSDYLIYREYSMSFSRVVCVSQELYSLELDCVFKKEVSEQ